MSFFKLKQQEPLPWARDDYTTPPSLRSGFSAAFPNLSFYWDMVMTVRRAGALATKGKYPSEEWIQSSYETIRGLEKCGAVFYISGMENFKSLNGPCVFVGNHMSTLETFALPCLIQPYKDVTFVVKDSLLKYPMFGPVLASREPIVVSRKDLRADLTAMLQGGAERLEAGRSIIVFPQSSRSVMLDPQHFNSIGIKMAKKSGVPVVPVALRTDSWGTRANGKFKDFGPVRPQLNAHFKFGEPMQISGNGKAEHAAVVEFIQKNLSEWGLKAVEQKEVPQTGEADEQA